MIHKIVSLTHLPIKIFLKIQNRNKIGVNLTVCTEVIVWPQFRFYSGVGVWWREWKCFISDSISQGLKKSYCSRRYTQESSTYYYPHEKYYGAGPTPELPGWDNNSSASDGDHAIPVHLFPKHVTELHLDQVQYDLCSIFSTDFVSEIGSHIPLNEKGQKPFYPSLPPSPSTKPSFFNRVESMTLHHK